jgi:hypothetical protein
MPFVLHLELGVLTLLSLKVSARMPSWAFWKECLLVETCRIGFHGVFLAKDSHCSLPQDGVFCELNHFLP